MLHRCAALVLPLLAYASLAAAQRQAPSKDTGEEFVTKLHPQTGALVIGDGLANLNVPATFRFLDAASARRFLTEAWGNPPEVSEGVLGLLLPVEADPFAPEAWAVVIDFDDDGYVNDDDAESIDYDRLLRQMQEATREANDARRREGYSPVELIGWATPPRYDREAHKLYWAKELQFSEESSRTLNYNIRVLGRRGVLVLNAVGSMEQLPSIEQGMQTVMSFVDFNPGHRYVDFLQGTDRRAAYGIAGLIAGAAAAKVGLFKGLWLGILALKKFIVVGALAVVAWIKRLFSRKDASNELAT